jgi:[ribosomal protein S5]-alanine N-acetyltransferase
LIRRLESVHLCSMATTLFHTGLFHTGRLTARRITEDGIALQRELLTDPLTMRTLSADGLIPSEDEIEAICRRHLEHWAEHGFGLYQFFETATGQFVGQCGLRHRELLGVAEIELFYALRSPFFRRGLGTEMARAVVERGFRQLGARSLIAFTLPSNLASLALMKKLGMQYQGECLHAGLPHVLYRLSAPRE